MFHPPSPPSNFYTIIMSSRTEKQTRHTHNHTRKKESHFNIHILCDDFVVWYHLYCFVLLFGCIIQLLRPCFLSRAKEVTDSFIYQIVRCSVKSSSVVKRIKVSAGYWQTTPLAKVDMPLFLPWPPRQYGVEREPTHIRKKLDFFSGVNR